jgi:hypothetical protein
LRFSSSQGRQARGIEEGRRLRHELRFVEQCDALVRRMVLGLSRLTAGPASRRPRAS